MSAISTSPSPEKPRALAAILWGGVIAGAFDLTYATVFYSFRGVKPIRVSQSIASGLLGPKAYEGGVATAILGVVLHFVIAMGAATVFYLVSRKLTFLTQKPILGGPLYGAAIYFFMHFVVLPLAANPRFRTTTLSIATVSDFLIHLDWAVHRTGCAPILPMRVLQDSSILSAYRIGGSAKDGDIHGADKIT